MKHKPHRKGPARPCPAVPRSLLLATAPLLALTSMEAAEKTFRHVRFEPLALSNAGSGMQLGEFTFSRGGVVLNLNNRDGSGTDVIAVAVTSGAQDPNAAEGPMKVTDGLPSASGVEPASKWFTGTPFATPLVFDFGEGTPLTFDAYNFATGNDSANYGNRTPVTWALSGSQDGVSWEVLDTRVDVPVNNANNTYQAGFTVPAAASPMVKTFDYLAGSTTSAVLLNGGSITFDWTTQYGDEDGVTLTPDAGPQPVNGSATVSPPDNSLTPYVLTAATATPPLSRSRTLNVRTVAGGPSTWQYVRLTITRRRPDTAGMVQLSEFEFLSNGVKVPVSAVGNEGGSNAPDAGEGASKLVDGLTNTKWLDGNNQPVVFDFGSPVAFDAYQFVTGNDAPDRDPVSWKLEGSNDLGTWTEFERVDYIYPTPVARTFSSRSIPLPGNSLAPTIPLFTGDAPVLIAGEPFKLSWSTTAAASVTISPSVGDGTLPLSGSVSAAPAETTTYTLTATSSGGVAVTAAYQVTVIPPPATDVIAYDDFSTAGGGTGAAAECRHQRHPPAGGAGTPEPKRGRVVPQTPGGGRRV